MKIIREIVEIVEVIEVTLLLGTLTLLLILGGKNLDQLEDKLQERGDS
jgi:hypothetical protein